MKADNKYRLLQNLFSDDICDTNNRKIDYNVSTRDNNTLGLSLAWATSYFYFHDMPIYKSDLQYCNDVIKKLIEVIGYNEHKITPDYIKSKLNLENKPYEPNSVWLNSYKELLQILKFQKFIYEK